MNLREIQSERRETPVEVTLSRGFSFANLSSYISDGKTIKFIVTKDKKVILGLGLHFQITKENGLTDEDVAIQGQFRLKDEDIIFSYSDYRERRVSFETGIDSFLRASGVEFNKSRLDSVYNL